MHSLMLEHLPPELLVLESLALEQPVLDEKDIHVWLVPRPSTVSPALLALTTAAEQARAQGMLSEKRRCEWLTGRALLRACLAHYTGRDALTLDWHYSEHGKPQLADAPAFNLSHGPNWIGCAVGKVDWLGIDIDCHDRKNSIADIAERYFHPDEWAWISSADNEAILRARFFTHWTLKEAYIKALGETINSVQLHNIAFDTREAIPQAAFLTPAEQWHFRHWMFDSNQHVSIACGADVPENIEPVRRFRFFVKDFQ
jgi:4'-phosphopantetheinyl transferase